jgi:hypothetical protein
VTYSVFLDDDCWCECGNPKSVKSECCPRCTYLDGTRTGAAIICALRGTDGLTAQEIHAAIGGGYESATTRSLQVLMRAGRVRRYWRESAQERDGWLVTSGTTGCWVYILDGKTAEGR